MPSPTRSQMRSELGTSGLRRVGGQILEEYLRELRGPRAHATYDQMATTAPIGAALTTLTMLCRQVAWTVEPDEDDVDPDGRAEYLTSIMDDMSHSWDDFIDDALTMLPHGFAPCEIVLKDRVAGKSRHTDGLVGVAKLPLRGQTSVSRWLTDEQGGIQGLVQRTDDMRSEVPIPIGKLLLFRTSRRQNNPEGVSVLRSAYQAWYSYKKARVLQLIGVERDLAGIPVFGVPAEVFHENGDELDMWKKVATRIRNDEQTGIVMPIAYATDDDGRVEPNAPMYTFELAASPGPKQQDVQAIIADLRMEMLLAMMADVLLLGHEKIGTQALAAERVDLLNAALNGWLDTIEDVLNRHLVPKLWALNGWDPAAHATFRHERVARKDVEQFAQALLRASQSGLVLEGSQLDWVAEEFLGLPAPTDEEREAREAEMVPVAPVVSPQSGGQPGDEDEALEGLG